MFKPTPPGYKATGLQKSQLTVPGFKNIKFTPIQLFGILILFLVGLGGLQSLASAQNDDVASTQGSTEETEALTGTLTKLNEKEVSIPVSGVRISVFSGDTFIGESSSDSEGLWRIPVPGPGNYRVLIDINSLPQGLDLTDPNQEELEDVNVRANQQKRVIFRLGEKADSGVTRVERFSNLFLAGLRLGAILAIAGAGLTLIISVTNLINFAHGELLTMGALLAFLFSTSAAGPGWHLLIAVIPAVLITATFSSGLEAGLWRPLRKRGTSDLSIMIISIGISLMLRYLFLIVFEAQVRSFNNYAIQDTISFLSFTTTPKTLFILGLSLLILLTMAYILLFTKHGTAIRALADNADLARASGINVERTIQITWIIASITTAISGVFLGVVQGVDWDMGWQLLLLVFAVVILGGSRNVFGVMVGGFLVGIFIEVSTYWIGTEFKIAIALAIMATVLLFRPQGVLGKKERTA